jgi:hypothetical protein
VTGAVAEAVEDVPAEADAPAAQAA